MPVARMQGTGNPYRETAQDNRVAGKRGVCNGKCRSNEGRAVGTNVETMLGFSGKMGAAERYRRKWLIEKGEGSAIWGDRCNRKLSQGGEARQEGAESTR